MPDNETRGQEVKARREALGLTQAELASEAGVSEQTVRNMESDRYKDVRKGRQVFVALDRAEAGRQPQAETPRNRRASDTAEHRAAEQLMRTNSGENIVLRILSDGTRAIFVVPPGGNIPSEAELERAIREARGD